MPLTLYLCLPQVGGWAFPNETYPLLLGSSGSKGAPGYGKTQPKQTSPWRNRPGGLVSEEGEG